MKELNNLPKGYLTVKDYADMHELNIKTVYSAIRYGRLETEKFGCNVIIPENATIIKRDNRGKRGRGRPRKNPEFMDVSRRQMPKCPSLSCLINDRGRCSNLTECLYYKHKDGQTYCSMAKY